MRHCQENDSRIADPLQGPGGWGLWPRVCSSWEILDECTVLPYVMFAHPMMQILYMVTCIFNYN